MNKFVPVALLATVALFGLAPAALRAEPVAVAAGKTLYTADGHRVAPVYRVDASGQAQIILDGRLITVPAATLSNVNGKITTSLSRSDLMRTR